MALTTENTAALAPMPIDSVRRAMAVKPRLAPTASNGVAEILGERLHQRYSAHVTMGLAQLHRAAERHTRRSIRLGVESPRRR